MKRKLNQILIASALLAPTSVFALGMGQMQVRSALNQPLNARINLQAVGDYEIEQLSAQLASAQAFAQSGLERPRFLSDLQFSIQTSPGGNSFIQITSNRPIREPIVNFLLELEWPQGRLIREFAAFLDPEPSVIAPPGQAVAAAPPPLPATRTPAEPASQPQAARPAPPPRPTFAPLQTDVPLGIATYQVPSGDTLWGIAQRSRPHPSVSTQRMMEAIFLANPNAFTRSSMDNLSAGAVLRIPSVQEIDPSIDPSEAVARVPTPPAAQPTPVTPAAPATPVTPATTATPFEPEVEQPQVRLVPPDAEAQTPATAAAPATALDPALAIPLDQGRLKLKVAGLDDIRSRVANMDSAALSAMQQGEPTPLEPDEPSPAAEVSPEPLTAETQPEEAEPVSEAIEAVTPEPETPELATATPGPEPITLPEPQVEFQEVTPEPITAPQVEGTTAEPVEPLTTEEQPAIAEAPQPTEAEAAVETEAAEPQPETAVTEPVTEATQPAETAATTETQAEQPSTGDTEPAGWLRNPVTWALAGFAALLLIVVPLLRRRQRVDDREEPLFVSGEQPSSAEAPDERPTTLLSKASDEPVTELAPSEDEGITRPMPLHPDEERTQTVLPNPLERVELLLTAGRYTDAENVIRHALAEDPDNAVLTSKLLDIHYATKNRDAFVEEAEALHNRFEDKSGPLWTRIARMGRELAPEHALFASATQFPPTRLSKTSLDASGQPLENTDAGVDGLDFDVPERSSLIDDTQPPKKVPDALSGLDWQLPDMEPPTGRTGKPTSKVNPSHDTTVEKPVLQDDFEAQLQNVDFDFEPVTEIAPEGDREPNTGLSETDDLLNAEIPNTEMPKTEMPDTEMPNLDFALEEKATSTPIGDEKETSISAMSAASEDYVETKLDLAVAYLEMGDALGARTLLEEVVQEGSSAQKQRAEEYMGKLR